jgi:hypothetical protein
MTQTPGTSPIKRNFSQNANQRFVGIELGQNLILAFFQGLGQESILRGNSDQAADASRFR